MGEAQGKDVGSASETHQPTPDSDVHLNIDPAGQQETGSKGSDQKEPSGEAPKKGWFKKGEKKTPTAEELEEEEKKKKATEGQTFGNYLVCIDYC